MFQRRMGVEPTSPAWKAGVIAVIRPARLSCVAFATRGARLRSFGGSTQPPPYDGAIVVRGFRHAGSKVEFVCLRFLENFRNLRHTTGAIYVVACATEKQGCVRLAALLNCRHTTGAIVVRGFRHARFSIHAKIANITLPCQGEAGGEGPCRGVCDDGPTVSAFGRPCRR